MNKYLEDFAYAFTKVGVDYYSWWALNSDKGYEQKAEINFSTELIRHFRNLMEEQGNLAHYEGLRIDADVTKARVIYKKKGIRPDIVLHAAAGNQDRQEFFAEVKLDSSAKLSDDLSKLIMAVSPTLNYKYGVMIVVNQSLQVTEGAIKNHDRIVEQPLEKLYLFHAVKNADNETATHTIKSFTDVINTGQE